jgi:hypothetical protein
VEAGPELPRTVEAVLGRMDETYGRLHDVIDRLDDPDYERRTSSGWSVKSMIAHVAAWHDLAADHLESARLDGRRDEEPDVDAFNARVEAAAARRSAATVRADLERSFARLRAEVGRVDDRGLVDANAWALGTIASNTFDHHPEHEAELEGVLG